MNTALNTIAQTPTADLAKDDAGSSIQNIKDALSSATQAVAAGTDTVRRRVQQVAGSTDEFVRIKPWQAVGVAALVGVSLGFLAGRRS
jgi:ElaB/YqjD/DUF883 family membrane-anchored ribosome-binding protein